MAYNPIFFNAGPGGNPTGIGDLIAQCDAAGIPVFIAATDAMTGLYDMQLAAQRSGVPHQGNYRSTGYYRPGSGRVKVGEERSSDVHLDVPNYNLSPQDAAIAHWAAHKALIPPELDKSVIWISTANECRYSLGWGEYAPVPGLTGWADWMACYSYHVALLAVADGYKYTAFGWAAGNPDEGAWVQPWMVKYLELCRDRPDQVGINIHEYSLNDKAIWTKKDSVGSIVPATRSESEYRLVGRFLDLIDACQTLNLPVPVIHITEFGWAYQTIPETAVALNHLMEVAELYAQYPTIRAATWSLIGGWGGIAGSVQKLIAPVRDFTLTTVFPDPVPTTTTTLPPPSTTTLPPTNGRGQPRVQYKRTYVLLPPSADNVWAVTAADVAFTAGGPRWTVGGSADDAGIGNLDDRRVIAVNPEGWGGGEDGRGLRGFFETYYPGVRYEEVIVGTPIELRIALQHIAGGTTADNQYIPVDPLSQRDSLWSATMLGGPGSTRTIGNWGCLLVAYTMMANWMELDGTPMTPSGLNTRMVQYGAFNAQYIQPGALQTAFPAEIVNLGWATPATADFHGRIRAWLDDLIPVPARVDFVPTTAQWEQHWVLLIGYDERGYIMADPWTGQIGYVNDVYSNGGVLEALFYDYTGTQPPTPTTTTMPPSTTTLPPASTTTLPPSAYRYNGPAVTYRAAIHGPASDWMWGMPQVRDLFNYLQMPIKYLSNGINHQHFDGFANWSMVRVFWQPHTYKTPSEAWADVRDGVVAIYQRGARKFELHNEPNLTAEGMGIVWQNGRQFAEWMLGFISIMKAECPQAKLYYPGLSPGVPWTNQFVFTNEAWPILRPHLDGFCLHAYTGNTQHVAQAISDVVTQVREAQAYLNLQVPMVVSECSVNRFVANPDGSINQDATDRHRAAVYRGINAALYGIPGIEACVFYVSYWSPDEDANRESWLNTALPSYYKLG